MPRLAQVHKERRSASRRAAGAAAPLTEVVVSAERQSVVQVQSYPITGNAAQQGNNVSLKRYISNKVRSQLLSLCETRLALLDHE